MLTGSIVSAGQPENKSNIHLGSLLDVIYCPIVGNSRHVFQNVPLLEKTESLWHRFSKIIYYLLNK